VEDVNRLLKQFGQMRKMLKAVGGMAGGGGRRWRQAMQRMNGLRAQ
jgi:signal recognition particle GTPase